MKLYLVRHGCTDAKKDGCRQTPQSSLGTEGRQQVKALAKRLSKEKIDLILSSHWLRAKETAAIIAGINQASLEILEPLHERLYDLQVHGIAIESDLNQRYLKEQEKNFFDIDWKFLDGDESLRELAQRAAKARDELSQKYCGQTILAVTHEFFLRCFLAVCLLGDEFDNSTFMKIFHSSEFSNASLSLLEFDEGKRTWKIHFLNSTEHLGKSAS